MRFPLLPLLLSGCVTDAVCELPGDPPVLKDGIRSWEGEDVEEFWAREGREAGCLEGAVWGEDLDAKDLTAAVFRSKSGERVRILSYRGKNTAKLTKHLDAVKAEGKWKLRVLLRLRPGMPVQASAADRALADQYKSAYGLESTWLSDGTTTVVIP